MVAEAAVLSGLWVTQRDSYPVTVKSGYSVSELSLSPREILFAGSSRPDSLIVVTDDGYAAATSHLDRLTADSRLFVTPEYAQLPTRARKTIIEVDAASSARRKERTLLMVGAALRELELLPIEACEEAIRLGQSAPFAEANAAVLRESQQLVCRAAGVV
jgi:Pyruvate/2-oxoacid:ferredoxin oxidoreductase gamma subunit